jgi:hypothetical protein
MAEIILEKILNFSGSFKAHSVYRNEKITMPFLTRKCRGPCSYVKMTAALYQKTIIVSGKYFLYLFVIFQFVKFLSDTFMVCK